MVLDQKEFYIPMHDRPHQVLDRLRIIVPIAVNAAFIRFYTGGIAIAEDLQLESLFNELACQMSAVFRNTALYVPAADNADSFSVRHEQEWLLETPSERFFSDYLIIGQQVGAFQKHQ